MVLTAAHCVLNPVSGLPFRTEDVTFVAGWRLGQKIAHSKAATIAVHPDYVLAERIKIDRVGTDLALIRLADPIPKEKAPYFPIAPAPGPDDPLTLISYRRDRPHALTRQRGCDIVAMKEAVIELGCSVTFGASGSPIFHGEGADARIVAVLSAMGTDASRPAAFAVAVDAAIAEVLAILE